VWILCWGKWIGETVHSSELLVRGCEVLVVVCEI